MNKKLHLLFVIVCIVDGIMAIVIHCETTNEQRALLTEHAAHVMDAPYLGLMDCRRAVLLL